MIQESVGMRHGDANIGCGGGAERNKPLFDRSKLSLIRYEQSPNVLIKVVEMFVVVARGVNSWLIIQKPSYKCGFAGEQKHISVLRM